MKKRNLNQTISDSIKLIKYTEKLEYCNHVIGMYLKNPDIKLNDWLNLAEAVIPSVNGFMIGWLLSRVKDIIDSKQYRTAQKHAALLIVFDQYLKKEIFDESE